MAAVRDWVALVLMVSAVVQAYCFVPSSRLLSAKSSSSRHLSMALVDYTHYSITSRSDKRV